MSRLTIIKSDNAVGIDGVFLKIDCSSLPANFHAMEFFEETSSGNVQYSGNPRPPNIEITEIGEYASFFDTWKQMRPIPTEQPSFTDTQICEEIAPTKVGTEWYQAWAVRDLTPTELADNAEARRVKLSREINTYRDAKIAEGFSFDGVMFDSRSEDQKRISGAGTLAFIAISQGAQAGDLYWHGGTEPFVWISKNNDLITMDAYTVVDFGRAAAKHETAHVFAARALKDMNPIPDDYSNPMYWPAST